MQYSKDQEEALKKMNTWFLKTQSDPAKVPQVFYLAGWAGTGKTTIVEEFTSSLSEKFKILYGSFTGKAALRMRQVGMKGAGTLHSLIYEARTDKNTGQPIFEINHRSALAKADLLVLDECSMVGGELGRDVESFNKPILILGDEGQLPPIKGLGYFTSRQPDARLTEVHRQALENPIIELATAIRKGETIKRYDTEQLITYPKQDFLREHLLKADQILCGKNNTRQQINTYMRSYYNHDSVYPVENDKIICLRNNQKQNLFNGQTGTMVADATGKNYKELSFVDEEDKFYKIFAHKLGFEDDTQFKDMSYTERKLSNEFTYAYAITVHKSQGSQWDKLCLIDDNFLVWDRSNRRRWLYTAVTRAAEQLIIGRYPKGGF